MSLRRWLSQKNLKAVACHYNIINKNNKILKKVLWNDNYNRIVYILEKNINQERVN